MTWSFNKALCYWFGPDGNGGEWRIYPACEACPTTFLDHFIYCKPSEIAVVRVRSFPDIDAARAETEKRQASIEARQAAS
jgi:hypothetical protein